jgi:hypothetical protein
VRAAALLAALVAFAGGCVTTSLLLQSEQRTLVQRLMKELESGQKQLEQNVENRQWEAARRIADEMLVSARRLQEIQPRKGARDWRLRSMELEHDLSLAIRESLLENAEAVEDQLDYLDFTCASCHRKFWKGRPW